MTRDSGDLHKPQVWVLERTVECDTLKEIWEDLAATASGPQYVWRERKRSRSRVNEKVEIEAK